MTVISPSPPSKVLSLCESASLGWSTCYIRILAQPAASLSLQFALFGLWTLILLINNQGSYTRIVLEPTPSPVESAYPFSAFRD
ncbi:hypothetical protein PM082_023846 [Marasmius tenuissimus]|nr:hypothetical protein PM082_023846 [Marasmius tenuissimus]